MRGSCVFRTNPTLHASGDGVIKMVSVLVLGSMRAAGDIARFGEEYIVLLPETNVAQALQLAERTRT